MRIARRFLTDISEAAKRRADFKRRQNTSFIDCTSLYIRSGVGGNGCVAFERDAYVPYGPPSGGHGGPGGNVYVLPVKGMTSLKGVGRFVRAKPGEHGKGSWQGGKKGDDVVMRVPVGTVVTEIDREVWEEKVRERIAEVDEDCKFLRRKIKREQKGSEWKPLEGAGVHVLERKVEENEAETPEEELEEEERLKALKEHFFVSHPSPSMELDPNNVHFLRLLLQTIVEHKHTLKNSLRRPTLNYDLSTQSVPAPILLLRGGAGGLGNPAFTSEHIRSPKIATRGDAGQELRLSLELKLLADVSLVGFPNAGKSTLLRAVSSSRTHIAPYAFTTMNPHLGVVQLFTDGSFGDGRDDVIADSPEDGEARWRPPGGKFANAGKEEKLRFTMMDCPGLLPDASKNVGLGHAFLRHVERAKALLYVVSIHGADGKPWEELEVLRNELIAYMDGLDKRVWGVVVTKMDEVDPEVGRTTLLKIEEWVRETERKEGREGALRVIPVSAKFRMNTTKLVWTFGDWIRDLREREKALEEAELAKAAEGEQE
ncbi:GTP-binding protein Obg/CgtA [Atractiella rhizophila]|nr:GTP-binding protein Obg/CgtA [Atractiella rhizophila]